jgi:hypothetical protein
MSKEKISLISQMIGYTAECSKTGTLFKMEKYSGTPPWCPLSRDEDLESYHKLS